MRKITAVLLCLLLMQTGMAAVSAKEKKSDTEDDGNGEIVTNLPWNQEIEGKIYGQLIGKVKDDDIDIDLPDTGGEEGPEDPKNPDSGNQEGDKTDNDKERPGDEEEPGGDQTEEGSKGDKLEDPTGGEQGTSAIGAFYPNITAANQQRFGIRNDGTDKNGNLYYKWEEKVERLTIYPALFEKAKEEQKNIVMRVVDRNEGKMHYRLRLLYSDIKNMKESTLHFEFGARCEHKEPMYEVTGTNEIVYLLQCKQEYISIPVYIGVGVPKNWDHSYGVYQYSYENQDLVYIRKDLQIDEENIIEVKMAPEKDYVFGNQTLPVEGKNLNTWVSGLVGGSQRVDQKTALGSAAMFAAAGFAGVTLLTGFYLKKSGKGSWGKKRSKES